MSETFAQRLRDPWVLGAGIIAAGVPLLLTVAMRSGEPFGVPEAIYVVNLPGQATLLLSLLCVLLVTDVTREALVARNVPATFLHRWLPLATVVTLGYGGISLLNLGLAGHLDGAGLATLAVHLAVLLGMMAGWLAIAILVRVLTRGDRHALVVPFFAWAALTALLPLLQQLLGALWSGAGPADSLPPWTPIFFWSSPTVAGEMLVGSLYPGWAFSAAGPLGAAWNHPAAHGAVLVAWTVIPLLLAAQVRATDERATEVAS